MSFTYRGNNTPRMPVQNYKNYRVSSPIETHFKKVDCREAGCEAFLNGWQVWLDDPRITPALLYKLEHSGKRFRKAHFGPAQNYLLFEAGQPCFQSPHLVTLDRPEFYFVGRGHYTVFNNRKAKQHSRPEFWVEDMANHLDRIRVAIERG